jgi:hypothetical protein
VKKPYKLKLTKLEFLSSCDVPAQGDGARALLIKSADAFELRAKVVKTDDALGLIFGYAFSTSLDGGKTPHVDCQDDAIDPDFLKTVTEFIEAGGKTDVNHDFESDGKIVYAWPLLPEINAAMGITSEKMGLAVAVKPSAETYKRFQSGELTGFSIAGTGIREPLEETKRASRVVKATLYTTEVDGHAHSIECCEDGSFYLSWATAAGADNGHTHAIVFEGGKLVILADSGHSHELAEGQPGVAVVPADALVIVAARAPKKTDASKSTPPIAPRSVNPQVKETAVDKDQIIADLTKRLERSDKIAKMSGAHKAHYDTLTGDDAEAFLAKSNADRETVVKAARDADAAKNEVVYTSLAGEVFTKRDDARLVASVKRGDELEKAREAESIAKQAKETIGNLAGSDAVHQLIVRSLVKSGAPQTDIDAALTAMKGWASESRVGKRAPGSGGEEIVDTGPQAELDKLVAKHAADHKVDERTARLAVVKTAEGRALYNQLEDLRKRNALGARN